MVSIDQIEKSISQSRDAGGAIGEFEALQDIITALTLRTRVTGEDEEFSKVWEWYVNHLVYLHDKMQADLEKRGIPYQITRYDTLKVAIRRIRAILDTIPETVRQEVSDR